MALSTLSHDTKAYLRIESNGYVHEIEGRVDEFDLERYCDDYEYARGPYLEYLPGLARMKTKLEWGYGAEYSSYKEDKPVPTDLPDLGEFFD